MPSLHAYPCAFCLALSHAPLSPMVCFTGMYARCLSLHELQSKHRLGLNAYFAVGICKVAGAKPFRNDLNTRLRLGCNDEYALWILCTLHSLVCQTRVLYAARVFLAVFV